MSYKFKSTSYELQFAINEFKSTIYNFKFTSYNSNLWVTSSNLQIIKSMKTQVNILKSSSFPKIISLELFDNSCDNSYIQLLMINLLFYVSTPPWLQLLQKAEWGKINFKRRNLNFWQIVFNLRKQNVTNFFSSLQRQTCAVLSNYYCQAL